MCRKMKVMTTTMATSDIYLNLILFCAKKGMYDGLTN